MLQWIFPIVVPWKGCARSVGDWVGREHTTDDVISQRSLQYMI